MSAPTFSIILPTFRHGRLIRNAIASIRWQTVQDFEVFIVGDGAVAEGIEIARATAAEDPRFVVMAHEKGPGHGELYRDEAIRQASGQFIAYLGDDDLWLPDHLRTMATALEHHDFAYSALCRIVQGGYMKLGPADKARSFESPRFRQTCLTDRADAAATAQYCAAAHRRDTYLGLPEGWTPRQKDVISYVSMWLKFLRQPDIRYCYLPRVTALPLPSNSRVLSEKGRDTDTELAFRDAETQRWLCILKMRYILDALSAAPRNNACRLARCRIPVSHVEQRFAEKRGSRHIRVDTHIARIIDAHRGAQGNSARNWLNHRLARHRLKRRGLLDDLGLHAPCAGSESGADEPVGAHDGRG